MRTVLQGGQGGGWLLSAQRRTGPLLAHRRGWGRGLRRKIFRARRDGGGANAAAAGGRRGSGAARGGAGLGGAGNAHLYSNIWTIRGAGHRLHSLKSKLGSLALRS